ncbi:MAG: acyl-CoA thioesterase domain-containing protein, partial [Lentimonas sp.]
MRIFGGQVLAQCLMAANQTIAEEMNAHSMHAYFLRAGDPDAPIEFEVDPIRNGRSFAT